MKIEERFGLSLTRKEAESLCSLLATTLKLSNTDKPVKVSCDGKDLVPPRIKWGDVAEIERQFKELWK